MKNLLSVVATLILAAAAPSAWAQTVTRGPYLNQGAPTEVTVRWRTNSSTSGRVRYGTSVGSLNQSRDGSSSTTEHVVRVTGLTPNTKYYYSIGTTSSTLEGGTSDYYFKTSPVAGTSQPVRVWIIGDAGTADSRQRSVRDAFKTWNGSTHVDAWLMLGDNAYSDGTDSEYQDAVFDMYPQILRKTFLYPTRGNHERDSSPYYQIFTMPQNAEAGGVASGSEAYYSYDVGNVHFICLDSQGSSKSASGSMATWLKNDLAATTQDWVIAYWHHPPYSKGSHNSDSEGSLVQMRQVFNPILESNGVDMVFGGHSHAYERSILLNGQYGNSSEFTNNPGAYTVDGGSGQNPSPYTKSGGLVPNEGTVYTVAGSSGKTSGGSLNHPVMYISKDELGSVVLDFTGNQVDAYFIRETGAIDDSWTIVKGASSGLPRVTVTASDPNADEAGSDTGTFTLSRSGDTSASLTVDFQISGSATNGTDYNTIGSSVTFSGGSATATVTVTPKDDSIGEGDEDVVLTISSNAAYTIGFPSTATVTIADDELITSSFQDGVGGYSGASDSAISENSPTTNYGSSTTVFVDGDDPGGSGNDVSALLRWDVTGIPAGSQVTAASITVQVTNISSQAYELYELRRNWSESLVDWNEYTSGSSWQTPGAEGSGDRGSTVLGSISAGTTGSYTITLNASGIAVVQGWIDSPGSNHGIIIADTNNSNGLDFASREWATASERPRLTISSIPPSTPSVSITATDPNAGEPNNSGTLTVTRTGGGTGSALTVNYSVGGNATPGSDYVALSGSVTISSGSSTATIPVNVMDDSEVEGTETVIVTISPGGSYTVGSPPNATVGITDDDTGGSGDADGDGLPDSWELTYWNPVTTYDGNDDPDGDGLDNAAEYGAGTNPINADTDGDGMGDGWEVGFGLDPTSGADANIDSDGDGALNIDEFLGGTNPLDPNSFPGGGGGSGGNGSTGGACGATGLELILVLGLLALRRRK